jgi:small GTP-binding protein
MKTQKICMVGAFSSGKTSLVNRFVSSIFNEKYHTTIGVKIAKKVVETEADPVKLMIWDMEGVDAFTELNTSYLRGAHGILLVMDGTRSATLEASMSLKALIDTTLGKVPIVTLINKADLEPEWQVTEADISKLEQQGWSPLKTSAKTGAHVEYAFECLLSKMLSSQEAK